MFEDIPQCTAEIDSIIQELRLLGDCCAEHTLFANCGRLFDVILDCGGGINLEHVLSSGLKLYIEVVWVCRCFEGCTLYVDVSAACVDAGYIFIALNNLNRKLLWLMPCYVLIIFVPARDRLMLINLEVNDSCRAPVFAVGQQCYPAHVIVGILHVVDRQEYGIVRNWMPGWHSSDLCPG